MEQLLEFIRFNQYNLPVILSALAILLAGVWVAITVWVLRDITTRTKNILVIVTLTLLVLVLSVPGLIIYLLVRPSHTLEEDKQREIFYSSILDTEVTTCRHCQTMVRREYDHCPNCGRDVSHNCPNCDAHLNPMWKYCIECGVYVGPERKFHNFKIKLANKFRKKQKQSPNLTDAQGQKQASKIEKNTVTNTTSSEQKQSRLRFPKLKFGLPRPRLPKFGFNKKDKSPEQVKPQKQEEKNLPVESKPVIVPKLEVQDLPPIHSEGSKNKFKKKSRKERRADAGRKRGPYQKPAQFQG